jgi:hypothetical protein
VEWQVLDFAALPRLRALALEARQVVDRLPCGEPKGVVSLQLPGSSRGAQLLRVAPEALVSSDMGACKPSWHSSEQPMREKRLAVIAALRGALWRDAMAGIAADTGVLVSQLPVQCDITCALGQALHAQCTRLERGL